MGADVNNRNRQGVPNLVHACSSSEENEEFCIDLIRAGADVRLVDEVKQIVSSFSSIRLESFRKRNERRCTTRVCRAMPKWFENFYEPKPIQMLWIVKNRHQFTKQRKVDILKSFKFYPVSVPNSMFTMCWKIIRFIMRHRPALEQRFDFWVNEVRRRRCEEVRSGKFLFIQVVIQRRKISKV